MSLPSDGDNASSATLDRVLARARFSNATIYTIGIFDRDDSDRNPGVLKSLAETTGGERFLPRSAEPSDLPLSNQQNVDRRPGGRLCPESDLRADLDARDVLSVRFHRPRAEAVHRAGCARKVNRLTSVDPSC